MYMSDYKFYGCICVLINVCMIVYRCIYSCAWFILLYAFTSLINQQYIHFSQLKLTSNYLNWISLLIHRWQYVWLSLVASSVYFLESILCWMPSAVSSLLVWNNDIVQAVLNICYPTSQLYIGKKMDVSVREASNYIIYWLTLIAFKLWFGYRYIVGPVAAPSLELYDDYMNFGTLPFYKTALIIFVWWFPHFLVYCIDLSIWYSCWSSVVGGFIALVERQGAVRDSTSFRAHFMR